MKSFWIRFWSFVTKEFQLIHLLLDIPEEVKVKMCGRSKTVMIVGHNSTFSENNVQVSWLIFPPNKA